jgi:hypothetical protein
MMTPRPLIKTMDNKREVVDVVPVGCVDFRLPRKAAHRLMFLWTQRG